MSMRFWVVDAIQNQHNIDWLVIPQLLWRGVGAFGPDGFVANKHAVLVFEATQPSHLGICQRPVDVQVVVELLLVIALGDDGCATLHTPADEDLKGHLGGIKGLGVRG
jgi:hypothetical protein